MQTYGIPTAAFAVFDEADQAHASSEHSRRPVVKADGLALRGRVASARRNSRRMRPLTPSWSTVRLAMRAPASSSRST